MVCIVPHPGKCVASPCYLHVAEHAQLHAPPQPRLTTTYLLTAKGFLDVPYRLLVWLANCGGGSSNIRRMSLGITFGSIGDLIAVGQITFMLAKALNESQGSSHNYRGLIKELRNFDQALLQVAALWQDYKSSPEPRASSSWSLYQGGCTGLS